MFDANAKQRSFASGTIGEYKGVIFRIHQEEYSVPIQFVQSIIQLSHVTRVPRTPPYYRGVINLRGNVIPVIDLGQKLGLGISIIDERSRIIVVQVDYELIGLQVMSVEEVLTIPDNQLEMGNQVGAKLEERFTQGVGKSGNRLITLLDIVELYKDI